VTEKWGKWHYMRKRFSEHPDGKTFSQMCSKWEDLGWEGWELVSVTREKGLRNIIGRPKYGDAEYHYTGFFKRRDPG